MYLPEKVSRARLREAENARRNRLEIVKALSQGQITKRDLYRWGIFTVAGTLAAKSGALTLSGMPSLSVTGTVDASTSAVLSVGTGGIVLGAGAMLRGATVDVSTTGGGFSQNTGAVLVATSLRSTSGIVGDVALPGTANSVAAIGSIAVTSGNFALNDGGSLNVAGALTANNVTLSADTLGVTGSIGAVTLVSLSGSAGGIALSGAAAVTAPSILASGGAGGIVLSGTALLGQTGATIDVDDDGTVHVRLPDGTEQAVGQYAAGSAVEGLAFYARKYDDLSVEVDLATRRLAEGKATPDQAVVVVKRVRRRPAPSASSRRARTRRPPRR